MISGPGSSAIDRGWSRSAGVEYEPAGRRRGFSQRDQGRDLVGREGPQGDDSAGYGFCTGRCTVQMWQMPA